MHFCVDLRYTRNTKSGHIIMILIIMIMIFNHYYDLWFLKQILD